MVDDIRGWEITMPSIRVTELGTLLIMLKNTTIELTINGGMHITDRINSIKIAMSEDGSVTAINHPKGSMFGFNSNAEIQIEHPNGKRYAKMWRNGISFTTEERPVTFLIDAGGIKTTVDRFLIFDSQFTNRAFYFNSNYGINIVNHATDLLNSCVYWVTESGQKYWTIGDIRISESIDGIHVKIDRFNGNYQMRSNNFLGSVMLKTPNIHCTATLGPDGHMFVRVGNKRIHYDSHVFIARNEGQSAGIDDENDLKIF